MSVLLTRRAVVQVGVEDEYGVAVALGANDGVLVSEPDYSIEPNILERDFTRASLSQTPHIVGRKLASMTFTTELRGNGKQHSGLAEDAPIISRLFRACGYEMLASAAPSAFGPFDVDDHAVQIAWAIDTSAADNTDVIAYHLTVTTPGASGVAKATVTSDLSTEEVDPSAKATGTIVFSSNPDADSTVTINGVAFTFVDADADLATEVLIGATLAATMGNLSTKLNASTNAAVVVATYGATANTLSVSYDVEGTAGNAFTLAAAAGSNGTVSGATLTGGASTEIVLTSGTEIDIGQRGLTMTPTFEGNLVAGQEWIVWLLPAGIKLTPISDDFESDTLAMYKDGVKHLMPGAFGTFEIEATAGNFATVSWTFTGLWTPPIDEAMPTPNYERTLPSQVELARLRIGGFSAIVETFSFDQANDIQVRPDVNSKEGYIGTRIVSRAPEGGINPEADKVANNDFWTHLAEAKRMPYQMRVGHAVGNTVWALAPGTQYTGLTYTDRNGILAYDAGLKFPAYLNDDEVCFFLC